MTLVIETYSLILLGIAVLALLIALVAYPRKRQPLYRIEQYTYHDGTEIFYPMKRTPLGWKLFEIEKGIRGYRALDDARAALEGFLSTELNLEISESKVVKEYG